MNRFLGGFIIINGIAVAGLFYIIPLMLAIYSQWWPMYKIEDSRFWVYKTYMQGQSIYLAQGEYHFNVNGIKK